MGLSWPRLESYVICSGSVGCLPLFAKVSYEIGKHSGWFFLIKRKVTTGRRHFLITLKGELLENLTD